MKTRLLQLLALVASIAPGAGAAHEFWLWPEPLSAPAGSITRLTLKVGENFNGDPVPFAAQYAAGLRRYSGGEVENVLKGTRLARPLAELRLKLPKAGTHLVAYDSLPTEIILSADRFHAYLHDEGLDAIISRRIADGSAELPGRERYRRCVKSLVRVGNEPDSTFSVRTGQRLEIVPLSDPLAAVAGQPLSFALLFDGRPLGGSLVKAWHKHDGQTVIVRAYADAAGEVTFNLPYSGGWMVSLVHMIAAESSAIDWDSYWGSITFELQARPRS